MQFLAIQQIVGLLLVFFSTSLLPPILVSLLYSDGAHQAFLHAFLATLVTGLVLWLPVCRLRKELRVRDGFVVVVLFWTVLALFGAIPFVLSDHPSMMPVDAFFESMSGLTTTGGTVLTGIDDLPESIRYYRQQLQWFGGMGIIVLAVAIMPMLGIGGMQLYRAETPGPMKDNKITPRISETAKALWYIYLGLTVLCALSYWLGGMDAFDAIGHSFSTVATGGFSTHDKSIGYFDSAVIDTIAMVFMLLAGINFALHFLSWRTRNPLHYFRDPEVRGYFTLLLVTSGLSIAYLTVTESFGGPAETLRHGAFQVISVVTSTGFSTTGFDWWPSFLPIMLLMASCIGGCAGSTSGGIKVVRAMLLYKQGKREMMRLVHPMALFPVKLGGKPVSNHVIDAVWGFFALYVLCFVVLLLALSATGANLETAFSAVAANLNNLGPGLGDVANNYSSVSDAGKWILSFAMLMGRLELFTLLVLLTPTFWRG
ncbi:MAG: potassium transporter [Gammaproteobacteria bacterium]|nr:potassium transporter [Gammaproteobacteria bacterium]